MAEKNIKFERLTNFTGRNGYFKCSSLNILEISDNRVMLAPITSRGEIGRCDIAIPLEAIPEVIQELQRIVSGSGLYPLIDKPCPLCGLIEGCHASDCLNDPENIGGAKSLLGAHPCDDVYIFSERERDTIIAALRLWQQVDNPSSRRFYANNFDDFKMLDAIATNGGKHDALDENEIDILIEDKINAGGVK